MGLLIIRLMTNSLQMCTVLEELTKDKASQSVTDSTGLPPSDASAPFPPFPFASYQYHQTTEQPAEQPNDPIIQQSNISTTQQSNNPTLLTVQQ